MKIILIGNPKSVNSLYGFTGNRKYMSPEGRAIKEDYQWQAKSQYKGKPFTENLIVGVGLFFKDERRRDIDNYHKIILDSLTGIVWKDDSQIVELNSKKSIDKKNPRIELLLQPEIARS